LWSRCELEERAGALARSLELAQEERNREARIHEAALLNLKDEMAELRSGYFLWYAAVV
jgi:hypothetical protein